MKKIAIFLLAFSTISLSNCTSFKTANANTNKWIPQELLPSKILTNGQIFYEGKLSDGFSFYVLQDDEIDTNAYYYRNILYRNFGWTDNGDETLTGSAYFSRTPKRGVLYVNPRRRVAIYFYPKGKFNAFKVLIND